MVTLLAALLALAGCKQDMDNTILSDYLYDYAPVNKGHYVIYDVDSIVYNFVQPSIQNVDTIRYQVKELIADTFYDNLSRVSYRLELYRRPNSSVAFSDIDRVWYSYISKNTYERVEDDLRFIKLVFPPITGQTWSGNQYLPATDTTKDVYQAYAGWTYTYTSVNVPTTVNGQSFDSTLVVTGVNNENLVDKKLSRETYARHVGLIYKEWEKINKQDVTSSWDAPYKANGFRIRMRINSYHP